MGSAEPAIRTRLIEAAARILGHDGPAALSTRKLAAEVGTSTMAVYTHFGGLPALVDAVVDEGFARLADHLRQVTPSEDALLDLANLGIAYRANAIENPNLYAVMFGAVPLGAVRPERDDPKRTGETFDVLVNGVARAMEAGQLAPADPREVAAQLWSALHGFVMLELAGYLTAADDAETKVLWPMLTNLVTALSAPASPTTS